jgi:RIO kinase 2
MAKELEAYMKEVGVDGDGEPDATRSDEDFVEGVEGDEDVGSEVGGSASDDADETETQVDEQHNVNELSLSQLQVSDKT